MYLPPLLPPCSLATAARSLTRSSSTRSLSGSKSFREPKTPKSRTERRKPDFLHQQSIPDFDLEEPEEPPQPPGLSQGEQGQGEDEDAAGSHSKRPSRGVSGEGDGAQRDQDQGQEGEDVSDHEEDIFAVTPRSDEEQAGDGEEDDERDGSKLVGKFDGFRVKSARISLVDFTKRVSDVDKAALSRRPTMGLLELEAELLHRAESAEVRVELTEEQVAEMR
jgi:hypothetical protein